MPAGDHDGRDPRHDVSPPLPDDPGVEGSISGDANNPAYWSKVRDDVLARAAEEARNEGAATGTTTGEPWEPPAPFQTFKLPPFPVEALPPWLRDFVVATAEATQTPVDLAGLLALAVLATAAAKKMSVRIRNDYFEQLCLFLMVVMPPGTRKSSVFRAMVEPIEEYERLEVERTAPELAEAQCRRKVAESSLKKIEDRAAKAETPDERKALSDEAAAQARTVAEMEEPIAPRFVVDDITPERVATMLSLHGGRMAILSAEGDLFENVAGRYAGGIANLGVFLKGHAGDTLRVDRVGRPAEFVAHPALTVGLTVQPDVLVGLLGKPGFRGRGLLGRFLYALPTSLLGQRDIAPPAVPAAIASVYRQNVLDLMKSPFSTSSDGKPCPFVLRLEVEALRELDTFAAWVEPQLAEEGDMGSMTDWGGKLVGAVARIAGLLHTASWSEPWDVPISDDTVRRAIAIGRYARAHAAAAYSTMGADPNVEAAKRLLRWIEGRETFTKRQLFEGVKGSFKKVEAMEEPIDLLVQHGFVRELELEGKRGPGRKPSPTYEVNPYLAKQANCANGDPLLRMKVSSGV